MDTALLSCASCNTRLKVPATVAPGKKVKCPKCGNLVTVPAPAAQAGYAVAEASAAAPAKQPTVLAAATKRCPYCGESILADALKCRHCGEFLDAAAASATRRKRAAQSDDELNPAEYLVAFLFFPVALVIGLFWLNRKLPKAKDMLKVTGLSFVIWGAATFLVCRFYIFPGPKLPTAVVDPNWNPNLRPQPDPDDLEFPSPQSTPPPDMPPDLADLDRQPAEIQKAMRANVRIIVLSQQGQGLGSGVVIQRDGDKVLIVTNRHVVDPVFAVSHGSLQTALKDLPPPTVTYVTRVDSAGKVVWVASDEIDLALVEAPAPPEVEPVAWLDAARDVQIRDRVFAIGNPAGLGWSYTEGTVSALRQHKYGARDVPVVQTDTRIGPGNSGGGLYAMNGDLIGINTFVVASSRSNAGETGLGFAIRKSVLRELNPSVLKLAASSAEGTNQGQ